MSATPGTVGATRCWLSAVAGRRGVATIRLGRRARNATRQLAVLQTWRELNRGKQPWPPLPEEVLGFHGASHAKVGYLGLQPRQQLHQAGVKLHPSVSKPSPKVAAEATCAYLFALLQLRAQVQPDLELLFQIAEHRLALTLDGSTSTLKVLKGMLPAQGVRCFVILCWPWLSRFISRCHRTCVSAITESVEAMSSSTLLSRDLYMSSCC